MELQDALDELTSTYKDLDLIRSEEHTSELSHT